MALSLIVFFAYIFICSPKKTLLSGNRDGQLYAFVLPDTTENLHNLKEDKCKECTECEKSFSVLGKLKIIK